jgi:hypothetical protein
MTQSRLIKAVDEQRSGNVAVGHGCPADKASEASVEQRSDDIAVEHGCSADRASEERLTSREAGSGEATLQSGTAAQRTKRVSGRSERSERDSEATLRSSTAVQWHRAVNSDWRAAKWRHCGQARLPSGQSGRRANDERMTSSED